MNRFWKRLLSACSMVAFIPSAQALEEISIAHFSPPSLGAFMSPIIKARKFDEKNGLLIDYHPLPPDAYISAFNSGQYQVSSSAAAITVGLANTRGVDIVNLFNVFDFWCTVVTSDPEIKTVKDLEGHDIAAAKGTISYVMFEWLAKHQGADLSKVSVLNTGTAGLVGYAMAGRASAVELWEPAYSIVTSRKPSIKTLDLKLEDTWMTLTQTRSIPYQGVAAHRKWAEEHPQLVDKLYETYKEAGEWLVANPDEAAALILPKGSTEEQHAIAQLIRAPNRLKLNVGWAWDMRKEIHAVYKIGVDTGYLPQAPSGGTIFNPTLANKLKSTP